jgi:restriction system protein
MITSAGPAGWRDLQHQVARILREIGMEVTEEKKLDKVRGPTKADVYAEQLVDGRLLSIVVECKHWRRRVSQHVIHSFRSVVSDTGANEGYVVSSRGFQPGAYCAAEHTIVRLVNWEDFQAEFEPAWLKHHLLPLVSRRLDRLFNYTEPLLVPADVDDAAVERFDELHYRHRGFADFMRRFTPAESESQRAVPELPVRRLYPELAAEVPAAVLDATAYREFAEAAIMHGERAIGEFYAVLLEGGAEIMDAVWPTTE